MVLINSSALSPPHKASAHELDPTAALSSKFARRVLDGRVWCPVVELARILGFDKDGLAYQDVSGSWFVVSTPRFEQETGFAVRSWGGTSGRSKDSRCGYSPSRSKEPFRDHRLASAQFR